MRDTVVYVGGFGLPDRSASALRALGNAHVLREAGYEVLVAGKFSAVPDHQPTWVNGIECRDVRQPFQDVPLTDYTRSSRTVRALVEYAGRKRVAAVMAYNYPGFGLSRLHAMCGRLGIPLVNETTEWYGWEGFRPLSNARRILESRWRNTFLVRRAGNLICASHVLAARYPEVNSLVLPFALDTSQEVWRVAPDHSWCDATGAVRLVYSGSPGIGMFKDRLPLVVGALARAAGRGRDFRFAIVGISEAEYLKSAPEHADVLERYPDRFRFFGRIPHSRAVAVLKSCDISVFVRERNRVSEIGFPTKYAEATTCGVPVLTNRASDVADYLTDGVNGVLLPDPSPRSIDAGIDRVLAMSSNELTRMKSVVAQENPFEAETWVPRMRFFMDQLRLPR